LLKAISLFTGAGGIDYGFEAAGFETAVALEMDAARCETLRANRPIPHGNRSFPVVERDIHEVSSEEILETAGLDEGEAAVLHGGPPCQPKRAEAAVRPTWPSWGRRFSRRRPRSRRMCTR
jgi:DNA (cytosine-5)-methyltransferase 1